MRFSAVTIGVLIAVFDVCAHAQEAPAATAPAAREFPAVPARATPGDYQAQGKAGAVTIGAEFTGHFVVTPEKTLSTEDWVVVEAGFFGPPDTKLRLSPNDFSLRINGKKGATPSVPYGMVADNLKDPDWEPPSKDPNKPKTSLGSGGGGPDIGGGPPPVVHIPLELQREMTQRIQKASMPEGDRVLPQGGLLYFSYHGKGKSIHSLELIYNGPAGTVSMDLRP